jgi:hypothetical protein
MDKWGLLDSVLWICFVFLYPITFTPPSITLASCYPPSPSMASLCQLLLLLLLPIPQHILYIGTKAFLARSGLDFVPIAQDNTTEISLSLYMRAFWMPKDGEQQSRGLPPRRHAPPAMALGHNGMRAIHPTPLIQT